jgi:hypothetical protein
MKYSWSSVDGQLVIYFTCVDQAQAVCLSWLKHTDLTDDVEEVEITVTGHATEDLGIIKWMASATPKKF